MSKRRQSDQPQPRNCAYCGRKTMAPKRQEYEESTDGSSSRWPHAPRRVSVPPLCVLAGAGR